MGASASASLDGVACCHSDKHEHDLLNDPNAPGRAAASDEVVRPDGDSPAVKALPKVKPSPKKSGSNLGVSWDPKLKSGSTLPTVTSCDEEREGDEPRGGSPELSRLKEKAESSSSHAACASSESTLEPGEEGKWEHSRMSTVSSRTDHSSKSRNGEVSWKRPREAACAAMRYMGLMSSSPTSDGDGRRFSLSAAPEDFAVELLELALAVCTACAGDCVVLAKAAGREDRKALRRLSEFARRRGLLKDNNALFSGSLTLKELAQAFLGKEEVAEGLEKDLQEKDRLGKLGGVARTCSDGLKGCSDAPKKLGKLSGGAGGVTKTSSDGLKDGISVRRTPVNSKSSLLGGEALTLSDLAAREEHASLLKKMGSVGSHASFRSTLTRGQSVDSRASFRSYLDRGQSRTCDGMARTMSDLSCTSFTDFNRRTGSRPFALKENEAAPSLIEYLSVMAMSHSTESDSFPFPNQSMDHSTHMVVDLQLPREPISAQAAQHVNGSVPGTFGMGIAGHSVWQSEGAMTYHSSADAVIQGEGDEREVVQAEIINLASTDEGSSRVRIAFRSRCLRTQNEWQRHLLAQQRSLLQLAKQRKEAAEQQLKQDEEVKEEQKELLRGFRKIIQRELCARDVHHRANIFVVEKRDELRSEMEGLCRILEYPCRAFRHFASARTAVQSDLRRISSRRPSAETGSAGGGGHLLSNAGEEDWRVDSLVTLSSTKSSGSNKTALSEMPVSIILLGITWLDRELPERWCADEDVVVVLTTEAEEFEEVGRTLLASGEAEIRERLRAKGISDYLLHPLSLESLQETISQAIRRRFGDEYLLLEALGRGSFGVVHQAKRLKDGASFALKEISTRRLTRTAKQDVERETQLLQELKWPTVVFVVDAWENKQAGLRFLLMPLLKGGNLLQCTEAAREREEPFSREGVAAWYAQTLHGLTYLHWCGVLHKDLKPSNLLLAEDKEALQIGDLGSAAILPGPGPHPSRRSQIHGHVSTPGYASPELWLENIYMTASDVWSVGVSFFEVMTLQTLFPSDTAYKIEDLVRAFNPENPGKASSETEVPNLAGKALAQLRDCNMGAPAAELAELLRKEPLRRPTAAALAARPATAHRLRNVLTKWALRDTEEKNAHFASFERVMRESEAAADLPGQREAEQRKPSHTSRHSKQRQGGSA